MSLRVCKMIIIQRFFNVLKNKTCLRESSKFMSLIAHENVGPDVDASEEVNQFFTKEDRQYCRKFMENQRSVPVPWENLEQSLSAMKNVNIRSTVLRSCRVLNKVDHAVDYCQYIINKGEKLSLVETCLLIRVLANCKINLEKYDKLIKEIFDRSHQTILSIEVIASKAVEVFCQNDSCFKELLLKYEKGELPSSGIEKLIARAFNINEPQLAWKIANENPEKFSPSVVESYVRFCIRSAEQNKFSMHMINDLINFSKTHMKMIKDNDFYNSINQLTTALNKSGSGYIWSNNICKVSNTDFCSSCHYEFKPETVTAEELEKLKENFLKKVMICHNVNIKTTPKELKNFLIYLDNCEPYDIVIDGLNLFCGLQCKQTFSKKIISFFEGKGLRILFIGRSHFSTIYKNICSHNKKNHQMFLTRNDSLDDIFCLYAAMHQGLKTCFVTSDFFRDHVKFFEDPILNALFHKWQISHQYVVKMPFKKLLPPRCHSDVSQASVVLGKNNEIEEYLWHLSYLKYSQNFGVATPAQWICLRAKSKTSTSGST